jgi:hypothetical protein
LVSLEPVARVPAELLKAELEGERWGLKMLMTAVAKALSRQIHAVSEDELELRETLVPGKFLGCVSWVFLKE